MQLFILLGGYDYGQISKDPNLNPTVLLLFYWIERNLELRNLALQLKAKKMDEEYTPEASADPEKFLGDDIDDEDEEEQEDLTRYLLEIIEARNQRQQVLEDPPEDKEEDD
jgi:hypothetical protein